MSAHPAISPGVNAFVREPEGPPVFAPYDAPAGGWGALWATARALREQSITFKGSRTLLAMNESMRRFPDFRSANANQQITRAA
jgi:hypothetical protein